MEKEIEYDEYSILCYISNLVVQFAVRERFFVPHNVLTEKDLVNIDSFLRYHSNRLDKLLYKKYKTFNLGSGYTFAQCEEGLTKDNYNYKKNLALNVYRANKNLESWLGTNLSIEKDRAFFIKQAKVLNTKQEVLDEIIDLMKLEYKYAGGLASMHKLNRKKTLQKFVYDTSRDTDFNKTIEECIQEQKI